MDKTTMDFAHRKSRYSRLKNQLDEQYSDSTVEVEVSNEPFTKSEFNFIDLFAGAGGLSLGFEQAGFHKT